jgi:1,4-dihydroxy-2-naphthoate octaprenyltransferase
LAKKNRRNLSEAPPENGAKEDRPHGNFASAEQGAFLILMMTHSTFKIWLMAVRPKTLWASIAPVFVATAMAFGDGVQHFPTAFICLLAALAIQIGTNIANDYYDFKKGTDTAERIGPTRVTQAGLIQPVMMIFAFSLCFTLAALLSIGLITRGGWPIAMIGVLAILSGIFYTAGPRPLGYLGLGDVFVLIFFGPVAVAGTYYVQSLEMNAAVLLAGLGPGLISVAILAVNNLRDIASDAKTGKHTLAVRFGRSFTICEYLFSIIGASLVPVLIYSLIQDHIGILACTVLMFIAIPTLTTVATRSQDGPALNHALAATGRLLMIYSIMFVAGWIL